MKNIMLLVHADDGQESRFQCALDAARAVDGHLTCLDVVSPPVIAGDYVDAYAQGILLEDAVEAEADNRSRLEPRLRIEGVPYTWVEATGFIPDSIVEHAGLNDLVVVGADPGGDGMGPSGVAAQIVRKVDRPVLAVPRGAKAFDVAGTAIVAWDGSDPANAALRAAVPLLQKAGKTVIVTIGPSRCDPTDAAEYCARHGIEAEILATPGTGSTGKLLLDRIAVLGAAWMVMGAYGHSPIREAVFGGVTRELLEHTPVPLLIAA